MGGRINNEKLLLSTENNDRRNYSKKRKCSLQFPAVISGLGAANYWTSPAVPYLKSSNSKFTITSDQSSWIVSLLTIGGIIGYLLYPIFINRIGRKYTMLLFAIPQVFSWLTIYYASNVYHLYIARILAGIGYNGAYVVEIIYVGEIAEKNIRGFLVVIGKIAYVLGSLIVAILGAMVTYDTMNLTLLLISLTFFCTYFLMPESPYYYIKINDEGKAFQSLAKLRKTQNSKFLELEIENIKKGMMKNDISRRNIIVKLFRINANRKALIISSLAVLSVSFSGSFAVAAYMQTIVSYIDNPLKPEQITALIMLIVLITSIVISPIPDWLGRRILILCYGILVALSSFTLGGFFFYKYYFNENLSSIYCVPLVALLIYIVGSNSALFSISHILMSELFSMEVKSTATSLINVTRAILDFFIKLGFLRFVSVFEIYGVFWIFGMTTFIVTLTNYIIMPETKGKTLEEIQNLLDL
ncbi:facilitated trehalose transporter Tret1-like isoform X2 [Leptopilina heterotoma]|uniref:facilitated trehalose transporter Tret1-like isoform X2 n=1 Tax=Leptopilina heterotoma TaxID=63436 RepID=UPI001CAA2A74|nr:facilitated trehalose transporter Tret1-like isoform X2 [Leptopilina heterotoma]